MIIAHLFIFYEYKYLDEPTLLFWSASLSWTATSTLVFWVAFFGEFLLIYIQNYSIHSMLMRTLRYFNCFCNFLIDSSAACLDRELRCVSGLFSLSFATWLTTAGWWCDIHCLNSKQMETTSHSDLMRTLQMMTYWVLIDTDIKIILTLWKTLIVFNHQLSFKNLVSLWKV